MSQTGRLRGQLGPGTLRVVYGDPSPADIEAELRLMVPVDQAHVAMLAGCALIGRPAAAALLDAMADLLATGFAPLRGRPAPRGLYLMYEGYLIERLGTDIGGVLHTARSRNDLKATVTAIRLRDWVAGFAAQVTRLEAVLLNRGRAYRDVVMPVYTHFQAAMPVTYGYYLVGVALALGRDIDALHDAARGLEHCPLGAGAVAGTDLPIDPTVPAALLGFAAPAVHALDAVASRDAALRVLAAASGVAVTLSRLATDLQLWSTTEFGLVGFPDRLVGGSSAMPQKRNAFLLEHVKAKPGQALGAFAAAAASMAATPFTNSIEVGTEAVAAIWPGLAAAEQSVLLCQVLVSGARPDPDRMGQRALAGYTGATALANRLVRAGVPFRTAHERVGDAVREAIRTGATDLVVAGSGDGADPGGADPGCVAFGPAGLDLAEVVRQQRHGGGPGDLDASCAVALAAWRRHRHWLTARRDRAGRASQALAAEVDRLRGTGGGAGTGGGTGPATGLSTGDST